MSRYRIAPGHNNIAGLEIMVPQPHCSGAHYARRVYAADGTVHEEGALISAFQYSAIGEDAYQSLLSQLGLTGATASAQVTVYTTGPGPTRTFAIYNATIIRPDAPHYRNGVYYNADFQLVGLEAI